MDLRRSLLLIGGALCAVAGWAAWRATPTVPRTPIYQGIHLQVSELPSDRAGWGTVCVADVDIGAFGVELFFARPDLAAQPRGYETRLSWLDSMSSETRFALAVNGPLFSSRSLSFGLPGDLATLSNTVVDDGRIRHREQESFLLWLDGQKRLRIESTRGANDELLSQATWAVGGFDLVLWDGAPTLRGDQVVDAQTIAAIDAKGHRLWLAVFDHASGGRAADFLASLGAAAAIRLDGGSSSGIYIGERARGVAPGYWRRPRRPGAAAIGIRAWPIE